MIVMRRSGFPLPLIHRCTGFTLVELITTITIAAIVLLIAAPSLTSFQRKQRIITTTDSITSAIGQARSIAIATNSYVTIAPIDNTNWQSGWRVFSEGRTPNGKYDPTANPNDKVIAVYDPIPSDMAIGFTSTSNGAGGATPSSSTSLTYSPVGYTVTAGMVPQLSANFTISFNGAPLVDPSRMVIINALGRARTCDPVPLANRSSCSNSVVQ